MGHLPIGRSTIPAILAGRATNQAQLAISLGISRGTLRKYLHDSAGTHHIVFNGVFFSRPGYLVDSSSTVLQGDGHG
jgi:predicted transcriptional regulator